MNTRAQRLASIVAALVFATTAAAQPFTFQKIIGNDTGTDFHVQYEPFVAPSISGTRVSFIGIVNSTTARLYEWTGGAPTVVYTQQTPVPGRSGNFTPGFGYTVNSADHLVFESRTSYSNHPGLFHRYGGQLAIIADDQTPAPNGGTFVQAAFVTGDCVDVEGGTVSFLATRTVGGGPEERGLYQWKSGTLAALATVATPVPGGAGTFQQGSFYELRLTKNVTYFRGRDAANKSGIYRADAAGLSVAVDTHTNGPAGYGTFTSVGQNRFAADGDDLIFEARSTGDGSSNTFMKKDGQFTLLMENGTPLPGGGTFNGALDPCLQDGTYVFRGDGVEWGVYTNFGGTLQMIAQAGSIIDGKTVLEARINRNSYDRGRVVMDIRFVGDDPFAGKYDRALYLVSLPGPGPLSVLVLSAIWAHRRRR